MVLSLREIMTRDVTSVPPEMPLDELAELFAARHIGGAPVVSGGNVAGVVSAADVLTFAAMRSGESATQPESEGEDRWANELDLSSLEQEELPAGYLTGLWGITGEGLDGTWSEFTGGRLRRRMDARADRSGPGSRPGTQPRWSGLANSCSLLRIGVDNAGFHGAGRRGGEP
jgi:hypothetical protein